MAASRTAVVVPRGGPDGVDGPKTAARPRLAVVL